MHGFIPGLTPPTYDVVFKSTWPAVLLHGTRRPRCSAIYISVAAK